MKIDSIITGMAVLRGYFNDDGYHIGAEHDEIRVYRTDKPVPESVVVCLLALGWFQPEGAQSGKPELYDPNEGWACFP